MLSQTDAVKQAWAATDRTLDIIVTVDGKDYQATEINSLSYDAGAFTGDTLGIGSTYENSVTIEFSSVVEAFKQGLTVLPKIGVLVNGKFEYTSLGTFIVSEVNRDRNNNLTTIKALDQMCKLEGQYKPTVSDMASPLDTIADIANQGGVTVNTGELQHLPTLPNIKKIEGQTLRTAIGWVAQLYDGFATFDRDGNLTIRTTATPDYTITPGEYQQGGLTKNEVAYKTGGIKVTVNTKKTDDSGQEVDDTTTFQAGETTGSQIELTNDSMTSDLLTTVWNGIKDITYYPYTLNWFGNPNLEAGDWVTLTDTQGNQFNVPVNQYTMFFNGGLESTISATQSSSTAGGYAYTGSAGSIKNMIEALQVRHTASGNNVYPPSYQGEPKNPKKGDVWYKQNGNNVEMWIYQEDSGTLAWVRTPIDGEVKADLQALGAKTDEDLTRVKNELSSAAESQWESAKAATNKVASDLSATKANLDAVKKDLSATKTSLADTGNRLATATAEFQRQTGQLSGSLSTANAKIEFNSKAIAEVKHTAEEISTTVSSLHAGDRNLAHGAASSKDWFVFQGFNDLTNYGRDLVTYSLDTLKAGDTVTFGITMKNEGVTSGNMIFMQRGDFSQWTRDYGVISPAGNVTGFVPNGAEKALTYTITITDGMLNGNNSYTIDIRTDNVPAGGKLSFRYAFVKKGTMATDWTPAPEDTDQAISKVSQTADALRADLTNTKGDVASVKATAEEISTIVSSLHAGDRNLAHGAASSKDWFVFQGFNDLTNYGRDLVTYSLDTLKAGDTVTFGITMKNEGVTSGNMIFMQRGDFSQWTRDYGVISPAGNVTDFVPNGAEKALTYTITITDGMLNGNNGYTIDIRTDNVPAGGKLSFRYAFVKKGTMATDWTPAPEDTDQAISKVSQKADAIRADLTNTQDDVASVKVTANSLTTSMANAHDDISNLQQRADRITSTLSNGGVNLLSGTSGDLKNVTVNPWLLVTDNSFFNTRILDNKTCTARVWIDKPSMDCIFQVWTNKQLWNSNTIKANQSGYATVTFTITDTSYTDAHIAIGSGSGTVTFGYKELQIEYGDTATPWKPSNGDISSLQQTASGLTADMKDAKGNISSLQATARRLQATVGDDNTGLVSYVKAIPGQISSAITASKQATVITLAVDIHDMKTAGYYLLKGTLTNSPVDAWAYLRVITSDSGDRIYHQLWKDVSSTVYTEYWAGGWSDWATHINSDNLKSNVITAINQSTEGVSITGSKITLDGNVNVAPGFTLSADYIKSGKLSADLISGGMLNFDNIYVSGGLTANSISSGIISGQNLNINLDNGVVEFTKGNLHSTDGRFNISIDTKSFYLDMGNNAKLWINGNGFHLQESASQHLWMDKNGLHNFTNENRNGLWINDTELRILNSNNAGLIAKDGMLQFSAKPFWNSSNVYSGTLDNQTYGTIGFNSNFLSSSLNGIFIKGREGVVIGTNSYDGGFLAPATPIPLTTGSGINLPERADTPASIFTKSALSLFAGNRYPDGSGFSPMASINIGCDFYYQHNGARMHRNGSGEHGEQIYAEAKNVSFKATDWLNIRSHGGIGRIALDAQFVHSYPTYLNTTSAGANVYVAPDGALVRSSSARKYKTDIQDANNAYGEKLIEFAPKKWIDKAEKKRYEEDPENNKKPGYYYGLIADDLDAAGLDMLVNYGAEGEVEGINYDRLAVTLLPVIKSLKSQVASLKEQLKALTK